MGFLIVFSLVSGSYAAVNNREVSKKIDLQKTSKFIEDWSSRDKWDKFPESPSFAYYSVSSMKILKRDISPEIRIRVIEYIKSCQMKDGGFSSNPEYDKTSSTIFTYYAVSTLDLLGSWETINRKKAIDFVLSLVQPDGGILAKTADRKATLATTYYGVASLALLKAVNRLDIQKTIAYINSYREPHKGFCMVKGIISMPASTYMGIKALAILGGLTPDMSSEVVAWLKDSRYSGRVQQKKYTTLPTVEELSYVLSTLSELSSLEIVNQKKVKKFVESLYISENGGFGPEPGLGTTPPSTYHALLCLDKLGAISR